jgi:hypothetical protein
MGIGAFSHKSASTAKGRGTSTSPQSHNRSNPKHRLLYAKLYLLINPYPPLGTIIYSPHSPAVAVDGQFNL